MSVSFRTYENSESGDYRVRCPRADGMKHLAFGHETRPQRIDKRRGKRGDCSRAVLTLQFQKIAGIKSDTNCPAGLRVCAASRKALSANLPLNEIEPESHGGNAHKPVACFGILAVGQREIKSLQI